MTLAFVADHLWQSTLCAAAAALLAIAFRAQRARVRYVIWMAASVKFLVPFAVLQALGHAMRGHTAPAPAAFTLWLDTVSEPFGSIVAPSLGGTPRAVALPITSTLVALWLAGSVAVLVAWMVRWRRIASAVRGASRLACRPRDRCAAESGEALRPDHPSRRRRIVRFDRARRLRRETAAAALASAPVGASRRGADGGDPRA